MKIVQGDKINQAIGASHRGGVSIRQRLLDGPDGTLGNFSLLIARSPGRYSPRHRHNFEQFRLQLEGIANYGRTGKLKPGMIGYFPEGVHYGPQTQEEGEMLAVLVLQCGGSSGSGYPGRDAEHRVSEDMKSIGTFKDGVFYRNEGVPGKRNMDAFQAIWEHINQRPLVYPKPRYDVPILMHPDAFEWVPVEGQPGVYDKLMGVFTERRAAASFCKIEPGATFSAAGGRDIYFTLSGKGTVEGEPLRAVTTVYLDRGDRAKFAATETTELVHFHLPDLEGMEVQRVAAMQAAE
jgi:hypothetical protein